MVDFPERGERGALRTSEKRLIQAEAITCAAARQGLQECIQAAPRRQCGLRSEVREAIVSSAPGWALSVGPGGALFQQDTLAECGGEQPGRGGVAGSGGPKGQKLKTSELVIPPLVLERNDHGPWSRRGVGEVEGSGRVVKVEPTGLAEMGCGYERKQVPGNPEAWGLNQRAGIRLWREGGEGSEERGSVWVLDPFGLRGPLGIQVDRPCRSWAEVCVHQLCDLGRITQLPCTSAFHSEGRG